MGTSVSINIKLYFNALYMHTNINNYLLTDNTDTCADKFTKHNNTMRMLFSNTRHMKRNARVLYSKIKTLAINKSFSSTIKKNHFSNFE